MAMIRSLISKLDQFLSTIAEARAHVIKSGRNWY